MVQGTAADCTKYGSYLFFQWLKENDLLFKVKIVNVVHDELIVECSEELGEMIKEKVKYFLELAGKYFCKRVPLFAEPQIASKWVH
jgi:DNA polymerase-1